MNEKKKETIASVAPECRKRKNVKRKQHSKTVGQIFVRSVASSSAFVACLNTPVFAYEFAKKVGDKRRNRDRKAPVSAMLFSFLLISFSDVTLYFAI